MCYQSSHFVLMVTWAIAYIVYSLHGQLSGFHFPTSFLKALIAVAFFHFKRNYTMLQIWLPRYETLSIPWKTLWTSGNTNSDEFRKSYRWFRFSKLLLTIGADKLFATLNMLLMSFWTFFTRIERLLSLYYRSSKNDLLSLYTICNAQSMHDLFCC